MSSRGNPPFVGCFLYSTFCEEFDQPNSSVACKGKELEAPIRITGQAGGCFCQTLIYLHLAALVLRAAACCELSRTGGHWHTGGQSIASLCLSFLFCEIWTFKENTFWNSQDVDLYIPIVNCKILLQSSWMIASYTVWIKTGPWFAWDVSCSTGELLLSLLCSKVTCVNTIQMCILRVHLNTVFTAWC